MHPKPYISGVTKVLLLFVLTFCFKPVDGQTMPQYPISYRVFNPFVFNPAIAGSKDFFSVDLLAGKYGKSNSQLLSGNARLSKSTPDYFSSSDVPEFTNIGVGGYLFNELIDSTRNIGFSGAGSYHIQLDEDALSFLSVGVAVKAVYNDYPGNTDLGKPAKTTFYPNVDFGIYYYNANLFAGLSATNLLGNPETPDSTGFSTFAVSRQFFLQIGYKFVISKALNIILEPSLIVNTDDSFSGEITDMIKPALKLYGDRFCVGTYFNDFDNTSFFFQYKYPKFYIGTYFEMVNGSPFYKSPIKAEIALGINISAIKSGPSRLNHW
ncbi:MAG TPA: PorP/SprF family type IX secretion system membrane protein [Bacteroidales bacterium]|nr:PorP/SprF family type IX secretion system membrane protein [Bacteroidales bacterium]